MRAETIASLRGRSLAWSHPLLPFLFVPPLWPQIPLLAVLVKTLVVGDGSASVSVADASGEMKGALQRRVLEQYPEEDLGPGTALLLRKVGPGRARRRDLAVGPGGA